MDKMIVIVGPTASGKTALSVALAKALGGEVVSCDSMQIYRGMDVGTAKVTLEEMEGIPHHMVSVAEPEESFSAARFQQMADPIVEDILRRGKTVILAGGTGLYVDALVSGRTFAPYPETGKRQELEREADEKGMEAMLLELQQVDPETGARLHLADRKRILRALEVYRETGKPISQHNRETQAVPDKYQPIWIGLDYEDRKDLYDRINLRVDLMLEQGLLGEIKDLLDAGVPEQCTAMQAIGYKEFLPVLKGEGDLASAVESVKQESRRYAKRQLTWFRRNGKVNWIYRKKDTEFSEILQQALHYIPFFDKGV